MAHRDLNVLDASERLADKVNELIDNSPPRRLLHVDQMRRSVQAVPATISEGFGRGTKGDRARLLRIARAEAEETMSHLNANFRAKRLAPGTYWSIRNLIIVIVKMLNSLLHR